MTGKTHQVASVSAALGYYLINATPQYGPATLAVLVAASSVVALLPDTDRATGSLWRKLPLGRRIGEVGSRIWLGHRNLSHSLLGMALVALLLHWLFFSFPTYWGVDVGTVWVASLIAYGAHLLLDSITAEGIPLFFPYQGMFGLPPRPLNGARVITGKWFENLVIFPVFNLLFLTLLISKWNTIRMVLFL